MDYVLITPNISGIGGAQQYTLRKLRFLSQNGISVVIVTGNDKDILLEELMKYSRCLIPEISFPLHMVSKKKAMLISSLLINALRKEFGSDERLIFDSATVGCATWSEHIARRLNSPSFVYDVNGSPIKDRALASFASFKFSRGELIGCSRYSNQKLFANFPEYYDESKNLYVNVPFDNSEIVDDTNGAAISKDPNTIKILTVSRIEKEYLTFLIGEVSKVAQAIPNKTVELTMVLSRRNGKEFGILEKQSLNVPENMKVSFLGPIVPLTRSIFISHDLFVGGGTAALNAASMSVPTIINDAYSNRSAGVFGVDIDYFGYAPIYDKTTASQIERFLDDPQLLSEASKKGFQLFVEEFDSSAVMTKFMEHVERIMKQEPEYYSFDKISLSGREKLKKAVMSIAGVKGYDFLVKLYAKRKGYSKPK
jgi:glycosyltransferase involved in cell wall biosynthesis